MSPAPPPIYLKFVNSPGSHSSGSLERGIRHRDDRTVEAEGPVRTLRPLSPKEIDAGLFLSNSLKNVTRPFKIAFQETPQRCPRTHRNLTAGESVSGGRLYRERACKLNPTLISEASMHSDRRGGGGEENLFGRPQCMADGCSRQWRGHDSDDAFRSKNNGPSTLGSRCLMHCATACVIERTCFARLRASHPRRGVHRRFEMLTLRLENMPAFGKFGSNAYGRP
ncbi:hypothetical protein MRX96_030748 [Rhipicephalus microplus]